MALKREHLLIYMPFHLMVLDENEKIGELVGYDYHGKNRDIVNYCISYDLDDPMDEWDVFNDGKEVTRFKPLYRRLSQITKPITIDNYTFIPAERIADDGYKFVKLDKKGYYYQKIGDPTKGGYLNIDILNWPYKYFIRLVELHFDVFGKIDSGDASVKK